MCLHLFNSCISLCSTALTFRRKSRENWWFGVKLQNPSSQSFKITSSCSRSRSSSRSRKMAEFETVGMRRRLFDESETAQQASFERADLLFYKITKFISHAPTIAGKIVNQVSGRPASVTAAGRSKSKERSGTTTDFSMSWKKRHFTTDEVSQPAHCFDFSRLPQSVQLCRVSHSTIHF